MPLSMTQLASSRQLWTWCRWVVANCCVVDFIMILSRALFSVNHVQPLSIRKTCTNFVWFAAASWTHSTRSPGRTLGRASVQVVSARRGDVSLFLFGSWHPSWKLRQQTGWPNLLRNHVRYVITPQRKKAYGILWHFHPLLCNYKQMGFLTI